MKIEPGKFYRTTNGKKVRIYAVDGIGVFSIHGAVLEKDSWVVASWNKDGTGDSAVEDDIAGEWVEPGRKKIDHVWVLIDQYGNSLAVSTNKTTWSGDAKWYKFVLEDG